MNTFKSVVIVLLFRAAIACYDDFDYFDAICDKEFDIFSLTESSTEKPINEECQKCGIGYLQYPETVKGRVLSGRRVVPIFKYPWIVPLIKLDHLIVCGAALISENFVLTAAHCVYRQELQRTPPCNGRMVPKSCYLTPEEIRVGVLGRDFYNRSESLTVSKIIWHPLFSYRYRLNDVALLELEKPIQCSKKMRPVCLPTKDLTKLGQTLITAGWGRNTPERNWGRQVLREGNMMEVEPNRCVPKFQPPLTNQSVVCAIGENSRQSSCKGDSGTTLFGYIEKKFYAVGITSFARKEKCNPDSPVTFAKIYSFMPWIKFFVKNLPNP